MRAAELTELASRALRAAGLSEVDASQIEEARRTAEIVRVQNLYNLTDRSHEAVLDYAAADYVAMRLLSDPDTLLSSDLVVAKGAEALGLDVTANRWSPWGSYVSLHLWNHSLATDRRIAP